jgi:hypothetical protein
MHICAGHVFQREEETETVMEEGKIMRKVEGKKRKERRRQVVAEAAEVLEE